MNDKQLNKLIINATVAKTTLELHAQQTEILLKNCRQKCEEFIIQIKTLRAQIAPLTSNMQNVANKELQERMKDMRALSGKIEKAFSKDIEKPLQKMKIELEKQQKSVENKLKTNLMEVKSNPSAQQFIDILNHCDDLLNVCKKRLNECFMMEQDCKNQFDLLLRDLNQHDIPHMIYITDKHVQKLQHDLTALNQAMINNRSAGGANSLQIVSLQNSIAQLQMTCSVFLRNAVARPNVSLGVSLSFSELKPKKILDVFSDNEKIDGNLFAANNASSAALDDRDSEISAEENLRLDGLTGSEDDLKASSASAKSFTI